MSAPKIPAPLRKRFPSGRVVPLPRWPVYPGVSYWMLPRDGLLLALAFRFSGKRLRPRDVQGIELVNDARILWSCDAMAARMMDAYRDGARPVRGYVFVDLTVPDVLSGLQLSAMSHAQLRLTLGPDVRAPSVEWWGVFA